MSSASPGGRPPEPPIWGEFHPPQTPHRGDPSPRTPLGGTCPPERRSLLADVIDELWERRAELSPADTQARAAVVAAVDAVDAGQARVAYVDPATDEVVVDERAKRAILLAFRVLPMARSQVGDFRYDDRVPLKTRLDGVRVLPGAIARWGSYIAPGTVLMPSFVNIGAYVDEGTMVDTWATVGSGAQIGKNVHLSGGVGIGGVLEPPNAVPVVVEDEAMIGSRCMVVGGARVRRGATLGAGAILTPTTHVIDVETGAELPRGEAPAWSVCVGGTRPRTFPGGEFGLPCLLVLKRLPEGSRHDKSSPERHPPRPRRRRLTWGIRPRPTSVTQHSPGVTTVSSTMSVNSEPHRRVRRQGPVTLRGKQIPATTTDQRLLDRRGPSDWVHTDPWRVMRIQAEFVEGFGLLAELGPAVSIFGSARTARDSFEYATAEAIASGLVRAGYAVITGGGPGIMEAANKGAVEAGGVSVGLGIELPKEMGLNDYVEVGLEFRYFFVRKTCLHQVLAGVRGAARRVRHHGRAVRGADPGGHRQDHQVPDRPGRPRLLVRAARLAAGHDARPGPTSARPSSR